MRVNSIKLLISAITTFVIVLMLSSPLLARTVWTKGQVTTAPWTERYDYIGVNSRQYTFMPEIGISFPDKRRPKVSGEKLHDLLNIIRKGQTVMMRVQGHRIYEIIILK